MTGFFKGASYFFSGLMMLRKPKVRTWAAVPILVSTVLFAGAAFYGYVLLEPTVHATETWFADKLPWLSWMGSAMWVVFGLIALSVMAYTFVIVSAVVACPFNPVLAEAAEANRTGSVPPSAPWLTVIKGLPVTMVQETKKILYYLLWAVPALLLCLIFMPVAPFIWGAFSAWMLALEFTDYPMDNHGVKFREMRKRLAGRRMTSFGFGVAVFLFAMIPVLNVLTVPAAVCGATLLWIEELRQVEVPRR